MDKSEYVEKKWFVDQLSTAICEVQHNIDHIQYDAFFDKRSGMIAEEYLVIAYRGGAFTARNCFADSCYAIYLEIGNMLDHGYYDELDAYERVVNNTVEVLKEAEL